MPLSSPSGKLPYLALDVGNSSVKAGVHDGAAWARLGRFPSDGTAAPEVWAERLRALAPAVSDVGLASVVPVTARPLAEGVRLAYGVEPGMVSARSPLPFGMGYATPDTLGADRIAAAVGAFLQFGAGAGGAVRPVLVLDAGTAVTLDVVDGGAYLGGAIWPGPDMLVRSLARGTAQLPEVAWSAPPSVVGRSTQEAIQSGLVFSFLDGVAGVLVRAAAACSASPFVVATGGWAPWLAERLPAIHAVAPHLVLDGVRLLTST